MSKALHCLQITTTYHDCMFFTVFLTIKTSPQLLVFSVTPFKIDENKNKIRSIDKVRNLGNGRRYISKDPRQDSGQRNS